MQDDSGGFLDRFKKAKRGAAPAAGPDERDATIARLEGEIAAERERCAELAAAVDSLHFKLQVQEQSYAKQLAEARQRAQDVARSLDERQAELEALAANHEESLKTLAEARGRLERLMSGRDRSSGSTAEGGAADEGWSGFEDTINRLLSAAAPPPPDGAPQAPAPPPVAPTAKSEPPPGDMLAPELMFTRSAR